MAQNGYDAVKKHFDVAHIKWEMSMAKMASQAEEMVKYGLMLRDEAHASHRWVGQIGTQTWNGYDGMMKNFDAFTKVLHKLAKLINMVEKTVEDVKEPIEKWKAKFVARRAAWDEKEEEATDAEKGEWEDVHEHGDEVLVPTPVKSRFKDFVRHGDGPFVTVNVNFHH